MALPRAVMEVWRFYDSFMEPAAVYKVKCRRCGGGGVTLSHFTNQAEERQQVPQHEAEPRRPSLARRRALEAPIREVEAVVGEADG